MVMRMEMESVTYRGELDEGVECRGVQESTVHHELILHITVAWSTVRHDDEGGQWDDRV